MSLSSSWVVLPTMLFLKISVFTELGHTVVTLMPLETLYIYSKIRA